ncbi:MAG: flagellin, partial [Pseudomonadota bacterium]
TAASAVGSVLTQMSDDAIVEMDAVLSAINTQSGGRSLFSGAATDGPAITTSDVILDAARTVLAGAQTPEEIITALDDWFDDPNGFRQTAYLGSDADLAGFRVADGETVDLALSADDAVFADILKPLVLAAVTSDDTFDLAPEDKRALLSDAGQNILTAQSHLTTTQAQVGSVQARIDTFLTRNATEQTALEFAKGALLQADPYETATQLEAVQFQLQGLYTVTARTADLSLVNFIR